MAHCGIQGHRSGDAIAEQLRQRIEIPQLRQHVAKILQACLLCKHVRGGKLIQSRWDTDGFATKRNECMHMDYLYLGDSYGSAKYVLVLKDELTHYTELVPCDAPTSTVAAEAVLD